MQSGIGRGLRCSEMRTTNSAATCSPSSKWPAKEGSCHKSQQDGATAKFLGVAAGQRIICSGWLLPCCCLESSDRPDRSSMEQPQTAHRPHSAKSVPAKPGRYLPPFLANFSTHSHRAIMTLWLSGSAVLAATAARRRGGFYHKNRLLPRRHAGLGDLR